MIKNIKILLLLCFALFSCDMESSSGVFLPTELSEQQLAELDSDSNNRDSSSATGADLGKTIYLPIMDIYVARGARNDENPHGTDIREEDIREMLCGWGLNSINPIMLQMNIILLEENIRIHNVKLTPNRTIDDTSRPDHGKRYFGWIDFANGSFRGFGGSWGLDPMLLDECDGTGRLTGKKLQVDPVAHHVLFLEWGPSGGYTGGARSGIVNDVSGATRNVIAHEFGHMFSLGHVPETEENRLMNPVIYDWDMFLSDGEKQRASNYIDTQYINPTGTLREERKRRMKSTTKETGTLTKANLKKADELLNAFHPRGPRYMPYARANKALTEMH